MSVSCDICFEVYAEAPSDRLPRLLPRCGHDFCSRCIQTLCLGGESPACPKCRTPLEPLKVAATGVRGQRAALDSDGPGKPLQRSATDCSNCFPVARCLLQLNERLEISSPGPQRAPVELVQRVLQAAPTLLLEAELQQRHMQETLESLPLSALKYEIFRRQSSLTPDASRDIIDRRSAMGGDSPNRSTPPISTPTRLAFQLPPAAVQLLARSDFSRPTTPTTPSLAAATCDAAPSGTCSINGLAVLGCCNDAEAAPATARSRAPGTLSVPGDPELASQPIELSRRVELSKPSAAVPTDTADETVGNSTTAFPATSPMDLSAECASRLQSSPPLSVAEFTPMSVQSVGSGRSPFCGGGTSYFDEGAVVVGARYAGCHHGPSYGPPRSCCSDRNCSVRSGLPNSGGIPNRHQHRLCSVQYQPQQQQQQVPFEPQGSYQQPQAAVSPECNRLLCLHHARIAGAVGASSDDGQTPSSLRLQPTASFTTGSPTEQPLGISARPSIVPRSRSISPLLQIAVRRAGACSLVPVWSSCPNSRSLPILFDSPVNSPSAPDSSLPFIRFQQDHWQDRADRATGPALQRNSSPQGTSVNPTPQCARRWAYRGAGFEGAVALSTRSEPGLSDTAAPGASAASSCRCQQQRGTALVYRWISPLVTMLLHTFRATRHVWDSLWLIEREQMLQLIMIANVIPLMICSFYVFHNPAFFIKLRAW